MKRYKIGMSTCGQMISPEDFSQYAEAGVEKMELSFPCDAYDSVDWGALKRGADSAGIVLSSIHLPFSAESNPAQLDETIRCASINRFKQIMESSSVTGADIYVVHASSEPILDQQRRDAMENAKKSLAELAKFGAEHGVRVAVENLPRTCLGKNADEILELISVQENLFVCYDTNHLLDESGEAFIKRVGKYIITTHFSDYDFVDERHFLPGEGKINWPELMDALRQADYCGPLMYELKFSASNIVRSRPLEPRDFVQNAYELMENKPLTRIV